MAQRTCACGRPVRRGGNDCKSCHNAAMRRWRALNPPTDRDRKASRARAYAHSYLRRGKLERRPCAICGDPRSFMLHDDYDKPLQVTWLCRRHHVRMHQILGDLGGPDPQTTARVAQADDGAGQLRELRRGDPGAGSQEQRPLQHVSREEAERGPGEASPGSLLEWVRRRADE
jgi:hypothetical protein